ncbi:Alpha/Beta hydrolase protein [Cyathus striatus]|nr:Alpha/Beta hydrolase protein [Cyathus striatus]
MNTADYKTVLTQRGYTYAYYHTPNPHKGKPAVLLIHGFPSTAEDWSAQFKYLIEHDYGAIAPDMLGYGGTDKPTVPEAYKAKGMTQDMIDILDQEGVDRAVIVSHDWGVLIGTRLVNNHLNCVQASIFVSHGCVQPDPQFNYKILIEKLNAAVGYDVYGYWDFFTSDGAAEYIYTLFFAVEPDVVVAEMATRGRFRPWMENKNLSDAPAFWTVEDKRKHQAALMKGGLTGPLNWYVARMRELDNEDDAAVPKENYRFRTPTLYIPTLKDMICIPAINEAELRKYCDNLSVKVIDSTHWVMLEKPAELNEAIGEFLAKI